MNFILLSSLLCLACSLLISLASSTTYSSELDHVTVMSASGEELLSALGEDPESDDGPSGLFTGPPLGKGRGGRRKHGGKKRNKAQVIVRQRNSTPAQNLTSSPAHSPSHNSAHSTNHSFTLNPCSTSHKEYCIHGYCTYLHDLKEPVCVCMKGYDGVRCGIQLLQTGSGSGGQATELSTISRQRYSVLLMKLTNFRRTAALCDEAPLQIQQAAHGSTALDKHANMLHPEYLFIYCNFILY
ncbi:uncharacterized protein areg isoform X1 [Silurus meridionalis]|uniref:uncharacterized protein areg isoform X1 n=1 Tax=Silurus meridionalis TaxID=175797 RepID=UPI001EEBEC00|nr:uncharacterized protein areg isoform X1 [Silurus meridionalis]